MAARATRTPLVTVIQADTHPSSQGLIWWKEPLSNLPTPVPVVTEVLTAHNLPPLTKMEELSVGDLTLVLGTPETDPLPDTADVTFIGPILWQKSDAALPTWVDDLNRGKPVDLDILRESSLCAN